MLRPVGEQPPSVYWRRRLMLIAFVVVLIVLIALTANALSGSSSTPVGSGSASGGTSPRSTPTSARHTASTGASAPTENKTDGSSSGSSSPSSSASSSPVPSPCKAADLDVAAVSGKSSYQVGDDPMVELQVTNKGSQPCVQNLADSQVELKIYNGESRVWGSHDCQIQPGTMRNTLAVGQPVRVTIKWSGLTSQPGCGGTRQRVGAGTYTLYAKLSGKTGRATRFTIG